MKLVDFVTPEGRKVSINPIQIVVMREHETKNQTRITTTCVRNLNGDYANVAVDVTGTIQEVKARIRDADDLSLPNRGLAGV